MATRNIAELRQKGRRVRAAVEEAESPNVVRLDSRRTRKPGERIGKPSPVVKHPKPPAQYPFQTSKFTPETREVILEAVRQGNYYTTACALAGVHINTLYRWLKWGSEEERPGYKEFYEDIMTAEAEAEVSLVTVIRTAAEIDYRAGLELLRRRFPERWGARDKAELTGANGGPIELVVTFDDGAPEPEGLEDEYVN